MKIRLIMNLHMTIHKLKKYQLMRQIQEAEIRKAQPAQPSPSLMDEAATRAAEKQVDLKKQTQFAPDEMGAKSVLKDDYGNKPACGVEENKADQSQFHETALPKGVGNRKKSLTAANLLTG